MSEPDPLPDFTRIRFPSDRLTIGAIRQEWPLSFDLKSDYPKQEGHFIGRATIEWAIGGTIDFERMLATLAYRAAAGLPPIKEVRSSRTELMESLAARYVENGLASGDHHARQLLRSIEIQAAAQARYVGGDRPR